MLPPRHEAPERLAVDIGDLEAGSKTSWARGELGMQGDERGELTGRDRLFGHGEEVEVPGCGQEVTMASEPRR